MNVRKFAMALAWVGFATAHPAFSQVSITPEAPQALETVRVHVDGNVLGEWVTFATPEMLGNKITVAVFSSSVLFGEYQPAPLSTSLGQLPAATYQVEVVRRATDLYGNPAAIVGTIGTATFTVQPKAGRTTPRDHYTDLLWNPQESGWGLSIHQHGSNNL